MKALLTISTSQKRQKRTRGSPFFFFFPFTPGSLVLPADRLLFAVEEPFGQVLRQQTRKAVVATMAPAAAM